MYRRTFEPQSGIPANYRGWSAEKQPCTRQQEMRNCHPEPRECGCAQEARNRNPEQRDCGCAQEARNCITESKECGCMSGREQAPSPCSPSPCKQSRDSDLLLLGARALILLTKGR